jgi:hypothetical protein
VRGAHTAHTAARSTSSEDTLEEHAAPNVYGGAEGEYAYEGLGVFFETSGPWVVPTVERALKHREREVFGGGRGTLFGTRDVELAPLGPGVVLYFRILSFLAVLFAVLTVLALPLLIIASKSVRASGSNADPLYVATLSLGNVGTFKHVEMSQMVADAAAELAAFNLASACANASSAPPASAAERARCPTAAEAAATLARLAPRWASYNADVWPDPLEFVQWSSPFTISAALGWTVPFSWVTALVAGSDVLSCVVVLVACLVMRQLSERFVALVERKKVSASDYTVFVSGLPRGVSAAEVRDHFSTLFQLGDGACYSASGVYHPRPFVLKGGGGGGRGRLLHLRLGRHRHRRCRRRRRDGRAQGDVPQRRLLLRAAV